MAESLIGKTVWRFDANRRVYRRDEKGNAIGGPIYREYWAPMLVFGETSRSWLAGSERAPYKIPKSGPHSGFALTEQEVEDDVFVNDHVHGIADSLRRANADTLRKVAELVGYKAAK